MRQRGFRSAVTLGLYFRAVSFKTGVSPLMPNWFYTDALSTRQGPVDDSTLLDLNRSGRLAARSPVWQEGMDAWVPFSTVAGKIMQEKSGGEAVGIGVCAHSGRVCRADEMLPYGEALIGPGQKESFFRILMEGAVVEIANATDRGVEYVGFWWRALSSLLDYMIKVIPSMLCMVPYYVVTFSSGTTVGPGSREGQDLASLTGFTAMMLLAYGLGMLGVLAVSLFYDTWMVGRYQATAGKMVIGAKVVNPDGSRLTYKRAFIRWLAKKPLNYLIVWIPSAIGFGLVVAVIGAASNNSGDNAAGFVFAIMTGLFIYFALLALCSGVYWMAAFDPEKRALHDRIASTRVVKK